MPEEPKILEKDRGFRVDPLYLTALASLGKSVLTELKAAPVKVSIAVLPLRSSWLRRRLRCTMILYFLCPRVASSDASHGAKLLWLVRL
jgi:hypothetical protein